MSMSKLIYNSEQYLKDAINNGINGEAINSTLSEIIDVSDIKGETPKQFGKTLSTIVYMKKDINEPVNYEYISNMVKANGKKIKSALINGITPNEVAVSLNDMTNNMNKRSKKQLEFMVKLISKMKKRELVLSRQKQNEKSYQKILTQ